jgi:hypothetical protein
LLRQREAGVMRRLLHLVLDDPLVRFCAGGAQ